jgi:hypothetical protein
MVLGARRMNALCLLGAATLFATATGAAERASDAPASTLQSLALPADLPERFEVAVRLGDRDHTLRLTRRSLRAPGFTVRAWQADGREIAIEPPPPATYRGEVVGMPSSAVAADLRAGGLAADVFEGTRLLAEIRPTGGGTRTGGASLHDVRTSFEPAPGHGESSDDWCGTVDLPAHAPEASGPPRATTGTGLVRAEIAFDVDFTFYETHGSSATAAIAAVESQLNTVELMHARDVLITYAITHIVVRTAPFYLSAGLAEFTNEWNTNQTGVARDVAHLVADLGGNAGVAQLGVVCDVENAYGVSSGPPVVMAHELGHNWNAWHCLDYRCNLMCVVCPNFGPNTKAVIESFRDTLDCLEGVGPYPEPLVPYAHPEVFDLTRAQVAAGGVTRTFDVLANDHDANLDLLTIEAFDAVSAEGGTVVLSPGTGTGGADELVYTAPPMFPGDDRFTYVLADGTGRRVKADPELRVPTPALVGYWKLDANGTDASGGGRTAVLAGATYRPGNIGLAVDFDGVDDQVFIPGLRGRFPSVTITAWVRRVGNQDPFAGIVVGYRDVNRASLHAGASNELRYRWGDDDPAASGFDSGLVLPDAKWTFTALVVEPTRAKLYLHDGVSMLSAENPIPHAPADFDAIILGHDNFDATSWFAGRIDDVRIYSYALTEAELLDLHGRGGRAFAPDPPAGGGAPPGSRRLGWSAGLQASSHDVYFGTSWIAVRDATPASPEYRGNVTQAQFLAPPPLLVGQTYSWRVDEVTPGGVVRGEVWSFRVEPAVAHWKLDETSGVMAADAAGGFDGTYVGSPGLGAAGARPELGSAVSFDGIDDAVAIAPPGIDGRELTMTAWIRRDGPQAAGAGILVSRSESSEVGIAIDAAGVLTYKWEEQGLFDTEFQPAVATPDGVWAFVAVVIDRDRSTGWVGGPGGLSSATRHRPNSVQRFDGTLYLGRDPEHAHFRGDLDDVRIYPFAMSPAQIAELFAQGVAAGRVPDGSTGSPLVVARGAGTDVVLDWSASCVAADADYAIYEGAVGDFLSHVPAACSTGGATAATLTPEAGSRYFLVVPQSSNREGSYGTDGAGDERPASTSPCRPQFSAVCP